eukprot:g5210.t1
MASLAESTGEGSGSSALPQLPPELKKIKPFLARAAELSASFHKSGNVQYAAVAYFTRYYAIQLGLKVKSDLGDNAPPRVMEYLLALMDKVEADKKRLPQYKPEEAKQFCKQFAYSIFRKADDQDRAHNANKQTARTFYAAQIFLDTLKQFGELDEEESKLRRYAMFKASDILKAIREGRTPTPGPPSEQGAIESGAEPPKAEAGPISSEASSTATETEADAGPMASKAETETGFTPSEPTKPTVSEPAQPKAAEPKATDLDSESAAVLAALNLPIAPGQEAQAKKAEPKKRKSLTETLDDAVQVVTKAISCDNARDYATALELYKKSLGMFMTALKTTQDPATKKLIMERMDAYMKRAEKIKPFVKK